MFYVPRSTGKAAGRRLPLVRQASTVTRHGKSRQNRSLFCSPAASSKALRSCPGRLDSRVPVGHPGGHPASATDAHTPCHSGRSHRCLCGGLSPLALREGAPGESGPD